jgi:hypothetical protein
MSDKIASQIEQESGRKLTNRQREFAKYYVEGRYSNAECARKAGFVGENVHIYASKLLNGREHPHVLEYVKELREEKERRYGVTLIGQLQRLDQLSHSAEEVKRTSDRCLFLFEGRGARSVASEGLCSGAIFSGTSVREALEAVRESGRGHFGALFGSGSGIEKKISGA